jgi:hypothetical protein
MGAGEVGAAAASVTVTPVLIKVPFLLTTVVRCEKICCEVIIEHITSVVAIHRKLLLLWVLWCEFVLIYCVFVLTFKF